MAARGLEWDFGWKDGGSGQAANPAACARRSLFFLSFSTEEPGFHIRILQFASHCAARSVQWEQAFPALCSRIWVAHGVGRCLQHSGPHSEEHRLLAGAPVLGPAGGRCSRLVCSMPQPWLVIQGQGHEQK